MLVKAQMFGAEIGTAVDLRPLATWRTYSSQKRTRNARLSFIQQLSSPPTGENTLIVKWKER